MAGAVRRCVSVRRATVKACVEFSLRLALRPWRSVHKRRHVSGSHVGALCCESFSEWAHFRRTPSQGLHPRAPRQHLGTAARASAQQISRSHGAQIPSESLGPAAAVLLSTQPVRLGSAPALPQGTRTSRPGCRSARLRRFLFWHVLQWCALVCRSRALASLQLRAHDSQSKPRHVAPLVPATRQYMYSALVGPPAALCGPHLMAAWLP